MTTVVIPSITSSLESTNPKLEHLDSCFRRFSQGGTSVCREAMFQKALSLMSQRCTSDITSRHQQVYERLYHTHQVSGTNKVTSHPGKPLLDAGSPPLGKYTPSLFYINQVKPSPMPPLKVRFIFTLYNL